MKELWNRKWPLVKEFLQKNWLNICMALGGACIIFGGLRLAMSLLDYDTAKTVYQEAEELYVVEHVPEEAEKTGDGEVTTEAEQDAPQWYELVDVDMAGLREINSDVKGWLYFENEAISYPILQGKDNDAYLRTTYDKKSATAGSIFMEAANASDFSDNHTIIYGHNMKDLSMFGKLKYYKMDEAYYAEHAYFQIITATEKRRYRVFAYKEVQEDSILYTVYSGNNPDFFKFAKNVISSANQCPEGVVVAYDDHVVTLSTCTDKDENRFIVCGILVDTK